MKSLCIYCGSNYGINPEFEAQTRVLGNAMAERGITLIYGGAKVGLMGVIADSVLSGGGKVIGIIPKKLVDKELAHLGLTELHVVDSMHERKTKMADLAEAFVALPGGIGTAEELLETYTWSQLGFHLKPCGVLNIGGFYDGLLAYLDRMVTEKFLRAEVRKQLAVSDNPVMLLDMLQQARPEVLDKWFERGKQEV